MSLQVNISEFREIWLYGKMKSATIYLDANITVPHNNDQGNSSYYIPSPNRVIWNSTALVGQNGLHVKELPAGTHVLGIRHATLTHVITFP